MRTSDKKHVWLFTGNIPKRYRAYTCRECDAVGEYSIRLEKIIARAGYSGKCPSRRPPREAVSNSISPVYETKLLTNLYAQRNRLRLRLSEFLTVQRQNVRVQDTCAINDYSILIKHTEDDIEFLNVQIQIISS